MITKCKNCGKERNFFPRTVKVLKTFMCKDCYFKFSNNPIYKRGRKISEETKKKMSLAKLGKKLGAQTEEHKSKIGIAVTGESHGLWKGGDVSYKALHDWLNRHKGKAQHCEYCNKISKRYHWANISGKYIRDVNDYLSLCVSCHFRLDKNKNVGILAFIKRRGQK